MNNETSPVLFKELPVALVNVKVVVLSAVVLLLTERALDGVRCHRLGVGRSLVVVQIGARIGMRVKFKDS